MKFFFSNLFYVLLSSLIAASTMLYISEHQYTKDGPLNLEKIINIEKGDTLIDITNNLMQNGIIENRVLFISLIKIKGLSDKIKYGEYLVEEKSSIRTLLKKITKGIPLQRKITVPEGLTSVEILQLLNNDKRIIGERLRNAREGEFAPETYSFDINLTKRELLEKMEKEQKKIVKFAWSNRLDDLPLKSSSDLVTLASIVEKEALRDSEKAIIASVFINRLNKNMRLQSDPTVIYALTEGKSILKRKLTQKDLKKISEYNTYKVKGLPPTPICNPGKVAIIATSRPAKTDFLYFVADGQGGHNFSITLKQHNKYVYKYRKFIKEN